MILVPSFTIGDQVTLQFLDLFITTSNLSPLTLYILVTAYTPCLIRVTFSHSPLRSANAALLLYSLKIIGAAIL